MKAALTTLRLSAPAKLFVFGATIGPIVDSFHNQCLLRYDFAPVNIPWPETPASLNLKTFFEQDYLISSSWSVPLLLGFAYVVLGDILPRLFQWVLDSIATTDRAPQNQEQLRTKAIVAVLTTAAIIKLSQYFELHEPLASLAGSLPFVETSAQANYTVLLLAALFQWVLLDGSFAALLVAGITSIGGPLSELPFVANHFWVYLPQAVDYYPLANLPASFGVFAISLLGENYQNLGISSITGPCYFAVTMDAIALQRWFQSTREEEPVIRVDKKDN